jgi:hypothetical protein
VSCKFGAFGCNKVNDDCVEDVSNESEEEFVVFVEVAEELEERHVNTQMISRFNRNKSTYIRVSRDPRIVDEHGNVALPKRSDQANGTEVQYRHPQNILNKGNVAI